MEGKLDAIDMPMQVVSEKLIGNEFILELDFKSKIILQRQGVNKILVNKRRIQDGQLLSIGNFYLVQVLKVLPPINHECILNY